jgi:hypothetical protein
MWGVGSGKLEVGSFCGSILSTSLRGGTTKQSFSNTDFYNLRNKINGIKNIREFVAEQIHPII